MQAAVLFKGKQCLSPQRAELLASYSMPRYSNLKQLRVCQRSVDLIRGHSLMFITSRI